MLPLNSPVWAELKHAYGSAENIPALLQRLESFPTQKVYTDEPWYSLWSLLAHQGDVYSASFAAVPWVIYYLSTDPSKADYNYFHFPAWVEICRVEKSIPVHRDLETAYFNAFNQVPNLGAAALEYQNDEGFLRCLLTAIAASKGQTKLAHAILELAPDVTDDFMDWFENR